MAACLPLFFGGRPTKSTSSGKPILQVVMSDGKNADTMTGFFNDDDSAFLKRAATVREDCGKPIEHVLCPRVVEAENDDTRFPSACERRDLPEVEIEREDDPALRDGLREDLAVGQPLEPLVAEMNCFVCLVAQPGGHTDIYSHVQQEPHQQTPGGLPEVNLLLCEPCGIAECLLDVLSFEIRVSSQHLLECGAVGELADDHRHGDAHPTDAGPSSQDLRVERDPIEVHLDTSVGRYSTRSVGPIDQDGRGLGTR